MAELKWIGQRLAAYTYLLSISNMGGPTLRSLVISVWHGHCSSEHCGTCLRNTRTTVPAEAEEEEEVVAVTGGSSLESVVLTSGLMSKVSSGKGKQKHQWQSTLSNEILSQNFAVWDQNLCLEKNIMHSSSMSSFTGSENRIGRIA